MSILAGRFEGHNGIFLIRVRKRRSTSAARLIIRENVYQRKNTLQGTVTDSLFGHGAPRGPGRPSKWKSRQSEHHTSLIVSKRCGYRISEEGEGSGLHSNGGIVWAKISWWDTTKDVIPALEKGEETLTPPLNPPLPDPTSTHTCALLNETSRASLSFY